MELFFSNVKHFGKSFPFRDFKCSMKAGELLLGTQRHNTQAGRDSKNMKLLQIFRNETLLTTDGHFVKDCPRDLQLRSLVLFEEISREWRFDPCYHLTYILCVLNSCEWHKTESIYCIFPCCVSLFHIARLHCCPSLGSTATGSAQQYE